MKKVKFDRKAIGNDIKKRMDQKGISTKEMAQYLGVSYQAVYKYLNGVTLPSTPHFVMIARKLETPIHELIHVL